MLLEWFMGNRNINTKYLIHAAIIAAIYAVLTIALAPLSYGAMQLRLSEVLVILPIFTPAAVPGLFVGCIIANIMSPYGIVDVIIGSLTTLLAAYGTRAFRNKPILALLPPVIANALFIGATLCFVYNVGMPLWTCMLWVGIGEAIVCYLIGYPLSKYLRKYSKHFELGE